MKEFYVITRGKEYGGLYVLRKHMANHGFSAAIDTPIATGGTIGLVRKGLPDKVTEMPKPFLAETEDVVEWYV